MKIIVCTGDSHTVGQGANSIKSRDIPKNPNAIYRTEGKGISRGGDLEVPSYVNLVRKYIAENTNSAYALTPGEKLAEETGYPCQNWAVKLEGPLTLPVGWDWHLVCVAEQIQPAKMEIWIDGKLQRTEMLHTPLPRYNDWSFRNVPVFCEGAREVKLVPVEGEVWISHIQHDRGEYAVVNSGVGSCTSRRYIDECFDYCIADFCPDYIIAEAHTINDWLNYEAPTTHSSTLHELLDKMSALGAKLMFVTVAPIEGKQESAKFGKLYSDFMSEAKKISQRSDVVFADANAAFHRELEKIPAEDRWEQMYVDNWHVNGYGHKLYANAIIEKLKDLLSM